MIIVQSMDEWSWGKITFIRKTCLIKAKRHYLDKHYITACSVFWYFGEKVGVSGRKVEKREKAVNHQATAPTVPAAFVLSVIRVNFLWIHRKMVMNRNKCSAIHRIPFFPSSHSIACTNSLAVACSSLRNRQLQEPLVCRYKFFVVLR